MKSVQEELNMAGFFKIMVDLSWIWISTELCQVHLTHFSSWGFFQITAYFLEKSQSCNVSNFCIISNLFHHKYNDKILTRLTRNHFPRKIGFPAKPVPLQNQYWMQKFFKFLMQKSFVSYWLIFKLSYPLIFATTFFCSKWKKKLKKINYLVSMEVYLLFPQKLIFDSIGTNVLHVTSFYFS